MLLYIESKLNVSNKQARILKHKAQGLITKDNSEHPVSQLSQDLSNYPLEKQPLLALLTHFLRLSHKPSSLHPICSRRLKNFPRLARYFKVESMFPRTILFRQPPLLFAIYPWNELEK